MRKEVLAGLGLAFFGLGVATPAAAEDWRACVVGLCLKNVCGDHDASVVVSMATNIEDPAIGNTYHMKAGLLQVLQRRGTPNGEPAQIQCSDPQPSESAASQMSQNIFAQMSSSFTDVTLVSPNDIFPGYDGVPGSEDPRYNGGTASSDSAPVEQSAPQPSDDGAAAAAAQQQAEAEAQREQERQAAAQAEQERQQQAAAARAEAERAAAAERERAKQESEAAKEKLLADMDARNGQGKGAGSASTDDDANRCVSSAEVRVNDTFQGNTSATVSNGCGQPVDVRICLMTEDKGWNCGVRWGVQPQSNGTYSSFHATGQVFVDAKITGSSRNLSSP